MRAHQIRRSLMQLHQIIGAIILCAGCSDGATGCRDNFDCTGGQVCANGQCRSQTSPDFSVGGDAATGGSDGAIGDLSLPARDGGAPGDGSAPICNFNGDGIIQASEAPFIVGLAATYTVNPSGMPVAVDLTQKNGAWDFSGAVPGDQKILDELLSAGAQWWSADFPTATHAEKLEDGQNLYGVYRATPAALQLLGIVSDTNGLQKTELTYATPIDVIRFPLAMGDHWSQTSTVTGFAQGVLVTATDTYDFSVDARGTTTVPALSVDTLRLRFDYSETVGFLTTTRITYLHLAECYGAVARIRSQDNEQSASFTQAAEYRRLSTQ
jgi:hypothetical protein